VSQGSRHAATLGYATQPLRGNPNGNTRNRRRPCRSGFSLLEVLLATSILVGCLVVLSELAAIGRRLAQNAQTLTAAQTICESTVNEILAGVRPPDPIEDQAVEGLPGWLYSVDTQPLRQPGLLQLQVTVKENVQGRQPRAFTLVQWLRDPASRRREEGPLPQLPPGPRRGGGRRP
jgi:Tfp pilus assembly protein PilV